MDDKLILNIEYENGNKRKCEVLSVFEAKNERNYVALLPISDSVGTSEDVTIELFRVDTNGEYTVSSIEDEEELKIAQEAFETLIIDDESDNVNEVSEKDLVKISFKDNNGVKREYYVIDLFQCRNRDYIALSEVKDEENEEIKATLMRVEFVTNGEAEGINVSPILSDMEFEDVYNKFTERLEIN